MTIQIMAQRVVGELESNLDRSMTARGDTVGKHKEGVVPTEVRCWTIDEKYGNITPIHPDTLHHQYQNNSLNEGLNGHYNHLGNLGSPRQSRIFMERNQMPEFIFLNAYDQFCTPTDRFRHYNTKSPFMNLSYNWCGAKDTGYDNFRAIYTQNIGKRANFGAQYKYMYGQGYYNNQSTGYMNTSVWGSYLGDKYVAHIYYDHNYMKGGENGGLTDERYITDLIEMGDNLSSKDFATHLSRTWNRQEHDVIFLNHHYNIGFYRTENDSDTVNMKRIFVPVTKVFHTFKLGSYWRNYRSYEHSDYHTQQYFDNDTIDDHTTSLSIRNNVGLSLCEGFHKWAAFGLNAYIGHEYNRFVLPDKQEEGFGTTPLGYRQTTTYNENTIYVGGQLIRTQGTMIHYNVNAEFAIVGEEHVGQFDVNGHAELNLPMFRDTTRIEVNGYIKNIKPSFYMRHFHSTYAWWDNDDTSKEWKTRIEGSLSNKGTGTRLTVGIENIKNYTYFANNGPIVNDKVTNAVEVAQCSDNIQVFSANLQQNLAFGPLHLDLDATFQTSSNQEVLPLPKLSAYANLYLDFSIAKVLHCELGADCHYFTEYYAPDYSPVVCNFTTQNPNNKVKIGNYPVVSAYANFNLKRLRFYVQYYHVNKSDGRYFTVPYYPLNPGGIHFGLSWNFYD